MSRSNAAELSMPFHLPPVSGGFLAGETGGNAVDGYAVSRDLHHPEASSGPTFVRSIGKFGG